MVWKYIWTLKFWPFVRVFAAWSLVFHNQRTFEELLWNHISIRSTSPFHNSTQGRLYRTQRVELIAEKINSTRLFRSLKNKLGGLCHGLSSRKNSRLSFLFQIFSRLLHTAATVLLSVLIKANRADFVFMYHTWLLWCQWSSCHY